MLIDTYTFEEINKFVNVFTTCEINNVLKERKEIYQVKIILASYYGYKIPLNSEPPKLTHQHTYM